MSSSSTGAAKKVRALGLVSIIIGIVMIVAGVVTWAAVTQQLAAEHITVSADSPVLAGAPVNDPVTAYVQAGMINHHSLAATGGKTYAELGKDDPLRQTAMTASFLRASLFTSVIAFGVALFAVGVGVLAIILGWAVRLGGETAPVVASADDAVPATE